MTACICLTYTGPVPLGPTIQLTCNPSGTIINESTVNLTVNCPYCITVPSGTTTITAFDPVTECTEIIPVQPSVITPCSSGMDVVFCVDYTGSMGGVWRKIKSEVINLVGPIISLSQNNYRLGLVIFDENNNFNSTSYSNSFTYTNLPSAQKYSIYNPTFSRQQYITAMEVMSPNNQTTFIEQVNKCASQPSLRMIILSPDGDFSPIFDPYYLPGGDVIAVKTQIDGKTVICGFFQFIGFSAYYISRITQTGSVDNSFITATGFNNFTWCLDINNLGQIIVGGQFSTYQGISRNGIALLNTNGSLNLGFDPGTGFNAGSVIRAVKFDQNGKILVGGSFNSYSGVSVNTIVRLNIDGSIDPTFVTGSGFASFNSVFSIDVDPLSNNIVVGGYLTNYNGTPVGNIVILNNTGGIVSVPTFTNAQIQVVKFDSNGKVLFGGSFSNYNGSSCSCIARLNSNFTVDTSFLTNLGLGFNSQVNTIAIQSTGKILVGGFFNTCNSVIVNRIVRLLDTGGIDYTFGGCDTPPHTFQGGFQSVVNSIDVFSNDSMFIGHGPNYYNLNCFPGMPLGSGGGAPEPSDMAIDRIVNYNITGAFNPSYSKYIVLITDNPPSGNDDVYDGTDDLFVQNTLIPSCQANNVKVILVKPDNFVTGMSILDQLATSTGGGIVITPFNDVQFNINAISNMIATLC
jgi:uncharacterized delta-60 repeat protein